MRQPNLRSAQDDDFSNLSALQTPARDTPSLTSLPPPRPRRVVLHPSLDEPPELVLYLGNLCRREPPPHACPERLRSRGAQAGALGGAEELQHVGLPRKPRPGPVGLGNLLGAWPEPGGEE